jgi:F-type H+-transporting ATPase subunit b
MMEIQYGQILSQIIAFLITLWILKRFAWKPLLGVMEERRQKIESEFNLIDREKEAILQTNQEYERKFQELENEARYRIQTAINEGRQISDHIQEEAKKQSKEMLKRSEIQVASGLAKAKEMLKIDIVNMSVAMTEKIIKEKLDEVRQKELLNEFVSEVEKS